MKYLYMLKFGLAPKFVAYKYFYPKADIPLMKVALKRAVNYMRANRLGVEFQT